MKVTIKSITTKNIVEYIADFARVSRNRDEVETTEQQDLALCKKLWRDNERTAFECINIDFLIEGVSRSLLAQITRYRHASYMVKSQRYCKFKDSDEFIIPDNIKNNTALANGEYNVESFLDLSRDMYHALLANGGDPDESRCVLPNASPTRLRITMNLRSFLNFYQQRATGGHASKEIHDLACEMFYQVLNFQVDSNGNKLLSYITDSMCHTLKDLIRELRDHYKISADEDILHDILTTIEEFEEFV